MSISGLDGVEYALTIWQPWAALIVVGPKDIENRSWSPPAAIIGKRIAIHAGLRWDDDGAFRAEEILHIEGVAKIDDRLSQAFKVRGAIIGTAVVSGWVLRDTRHWFLGPIGWLLTYRTPLPPPIACRGAQKLWSLPRGVREP